MTPHEWPYFIDCGAFGGNFDREEWIGLLDRVDDRMPHPPDYVVLPDVFNDAEATIERHREHATDVLSRGFDPAPVIQPGLPIKTQVAIADGFGASVVFVGGEIRWQRAHGAEIVETAHDRDLRVHIGNPGDEESLAWAYRTGFDAVDTSSILQNQYFHWLEKLESATHSSRGSGIKDSRQGSLTEVA